MTRGGVQDQRLDGNKFFFLIQLQWQISLLWDYYEDRSNMTQIQHGLNVWEDTKGKSRSKETPLSSFTFAKQEHDNDLHLTPHVMPEMQSRIKEYDSLDEIGCEVFCF